MDCVGLGGRHFSFGVRLEVTEFGDAAEVFVLRISTMFASEKILSILRFVGLLDRVLVSLKGQEFLLEPHLLRESQ